MLRKNLEHAERVFPFVVTCGRELDQGGPECGRFSAGVLVGS